MTAVVCFRASQPDYIDVDVYVEGHDGGEWNFSIFKDLETGNICFGDYRWAEDKDSGFEETDKAPSTNTWIEVIEAMPEVLRIIEEQDQ